MREADEAAASYGWRAAAVSIGGGEKGSWWPSVGKALAAELPFDGILK